jgi:uncharacterized protein (TIGR00730 family)
MYENDLPSTGKGSSSDLNTGTVDLHFARTNGPVDHEIDRLLHLAGGIHHPKIVREMIIAALKAGQETDQRADLKLMNSTLKEMRFTTKVFGPYKGVKKVTVFGSARVPSDNPLYAMARLLGLKLREAGYMVITGGGGGVMQAVNEGAGPEHSFGVNIRLPFEQRPNAVLDGSPRSITYKYFFNRKVAFIKEADAVALFPGGFGTLDEAMEILTLLHTGKRYPLPLVLIEKPGNAYWLSWLSFLEKEPLTRGYIDAMDFGLFDRVESVEEAVTRIDRFYSRYHSLRYVGEQLVLRLTSGIDQSRVRDLKLRFSDILKPDGDLYLSGPLPEEEDEPEISHLPRLIVHFNQKEFGRLRKLIDTINEY